MICFVFEYYVLFSHFFFMFFLISFYVLFSNILFIFTFSYVFTHIS